MPAKPKELKYSFTCHHRDGTQFDFSNPKDAERVEAAVIKAMEANGYIYVGKSKKADDTKIAQ